MDDRDRTTLLRLTPLAATIVAILWIGAIGFRAAWWTTGRIDVGLDVLTRAVSVPVLHDGAQVLAVVGTGVPALIEIAILAVLVHLRHGLFWAVTVAAACGLSSMQVAAMKTVAGRLRPDSAFGWQNSFPSGHTTLAALLATLLALLVLRGWRRVLVVPYPVAMAWSRTELHAHWLSDVLAGLLLGAATATLLVVAGHALAARPMTRNQPETARFGRRTPHPASRRRLTVVHGLARFRRHVHPLPGPDPVRSSGAA